MSLDQVILILELLVCLLFCVFLYYFYIKENTSILVAILTISLWFFNFILVALLPFDIYNAKERSKLSEKEIALNESSTSIISIIYAISYWYIFVVSWVFLPVLKEYENRGEFTPKAKLWGSIRSNLLFYGIFGAIIVVVLIVVLILWMLNKVKSTFFGTLYHLCIDSSNLYGLLFIIFMLGYSLPKLPLLLWGKFKIDKRIQYLEWKTGNVCQKLVDGKEELKKNVKIVQATLDDVRYSNDEEGDKNEAANYTDELREIIKEFNENKDLYEIDLDKVRNDEKGLKKESELITLNYNIKKMKSTVALLNLQLEKVFEEWHFLKSLLTYNIQTNEQTDNISQPLSQSNFQPIQISKKKRYYHLKIKPVLLIISMVLLLIFDGILLVSEVTFFISSTNCCLFGIILNYVNEFAFVHVFTIIPFLMLFYLAVFSLFRMKISVFIGLYGYKHSSAYSIMFVTAFICTIGFALCTHYCQLMKLNILDSKGKKVKTIIENEYGFEASEIDVLQKIMQFYPIILVLLIILNYFNVFNKIMGCIGFAAWGVDSEENKEIESDGRNYLNKMEKRLREKKKDERKNESYESEKQITI